MQMNLKNVTLILSLFACLSLQAQQSDEVALTIDGEPVYRSEVAKAFEESNARLENPETIGQFLPKYIDYRLNLLEAEKLQLDTTEIFRREYHNFNVTQSIKYLNDTITGDKFLRDIYSHLLEDRKITHVLLPYSKKEDLFPSDTLALYNKALKLRNDLIKTDFEGSDHDMESDIKITTSIDVESDSSYVGWITPFMFSYPVEETVYKLKKGEVSRPIRTSVGYHIIRLEDVRPARGQLTIEQVHYLFPEIPATKHQIDSVRHIAETVSNQIRSAADFDRLCKNFSIAYNTGDRGCEYGTISLNAKMPLSFIEAAYALEKPGDISKPVMTEIGFHIIRLKKVIPPPVYSVIMLQLFNRVRFSDRFIYYNKAESQALNSKYGLSVNKAASEYLHKLTETLDPHSREFYMKIEEDNTPLFTIDGVETYRIKDFADYIAKKYYQEADKNATIIDMPLGDTPINNLSSDVLDYDIYLYSSNKTREYARNTIGQKFPEAEYLIKKFRDDMMVFDVQDKNIWKRASSDEAGLTHYFAYNKKRYSWPSPRYSGLVVHSKTKDAALEAQAMSAEGISADLLESRIRNILNADSVNVQIEKGVWAKGENSFVDYHVFEGKEPEPRRNFPYHVVVGQLLASPQTYKDDRVRVEADYQLQLEKEWADYLHKKYIVKENKNVIKDIQ